jgi:hypothetical protein
MCGDRGAARFGRLDQAVGHGPVVEPAPGAEPQRAPEMGVGLEQETGRALAGGGIGREQPIEQGEIVLGLVDRVRRIAGRRPADPRGGDPLGVARELVEARQPPLRRAQRFEPIEGRDPGTPLVDVEPGVREHELLTRCARGEPQRQPLLAQAIVAGRQPAEGAARNVEEHGVLLELLGEQLLRQPRNEDDVEVEPAGRIDGGDEHLPVADGLRWLRQLEQTTPEHELHLLEIDGAHSGHRRQLGKHRQHTLRATQRAGGERAQRVHPDAPRGLLRKRSQRLEQRQRVVAQGAEIAQVAFELLRQRIVRIVESLEIEAKLVAQTLEPRGPAVATPDDGRVDEQTLPLTRGSQAAERDRRGLRRRRLLRLFGLEQLGQRRREHLLVRRDPARIGGCRLRRCTGRRRLWNLAEREILGKASRR